jgi:hypothetical protein
MISIRPFPRPYACPPLSMLPPFSPELLIECIATSSAPGRPGPNPSRINCEKFIRVHSRLNGFWLWLRYAVFGEVLISGVFRLERPKFKNETSETPNPNPRRTQIFPQLFKIPFKGLLVSPQTTSQAKIYSPWNHRDAILIPLLTVQPALPSSPFDGI